MTRKLNSTRAAQIPSLLGALFAMMCVVSTRPSYTQTGEEVLRARAAEMARSFLIVDTHIDVPYRLKKNMDDISIRTHDGDFDHPRAVEGGLDVPFMSIYVPSSYEGKGAKRLADTLITMLELLVTKSPDKFAIPYSTKDVRAIAGSGRIALAMGMENGSPVEGKLENLRYFHRRGIRYITLTHGKDNHICDSSYDPRRTWNGLSPFGKKVVEEMNRVGIMVDISHVSDSAFYQVLRVAKAPVIASHSSCRHFTPGWERNMSDEMLKALAANGGVICINFGSTFLRDDARKSYEKADAEIKKRLKEANLSEDDEHAQPIIKKVSEEFGMRKATTRDVADHIDHVKNLVGIDHIGLGSDFDGLGDTLPSDLADVSRYPNLLYELLKRGYSDAEIERICSGNVMRVWQRVEELAVSSSTPGK